MAFGADGALYVSAGEGASFNFTRLWPGGRPAQPLRQPPAGAGGTQTLSTAEGGRLRSQDLRTSSDAVGLDGSLIRINPIPATGSSATPCS